MPMKFALQNLNNTRFNGGAFVTVQSLALLLRIHRHLITIVIIHFTALLRCTFRTAPEASEYLPEIHFPPDIPEPSRSIRC